MKWHIRYLNLAKEISTWSRDPSTKVGAVIVRPNKTVLSVGFNGFPQCMPDNPAFYENREEKYSRIVHAEMNALLFAKEGAVCCTLYTYPFAPCDRCMVCMLQGGIRRFVFPKLSADKVERWGAALEKSKKYIREAEGYFLEVDLERPE